jgi:hypothetical protein
VKVTQPVSREAGWPLLHGAPSVDVYHFFYLGLGQPKNTKYQRIFLTLSSQKSRNKSWRGNRFS